jgi:Cu(I)/Ag(I) efflux system membrane fusion protein
MTNQGIFSVVVVAATLVLGGCGEPAPTSDNTMGAMPAMDRSAAGVEHAATGTVNSIDRAAGTINISHEPVASVGWPAMTMNFKLAEPDVAAEVTPGERVEFQFTTDGGATTVTAIEPAQ